MIQQYEGISQASVYVDGRYGQGKVYKIICSDKQFINI